MRIASLIALTIALSTPAIAADDPKARAIMEKVDARDDGDNGSMRTEMILIDRNGGVRTRHLRQWIKDFGDDTYRLMFFEDPADVKDTGFLTYDYDDADRDDDQWLYLPALKKTKRIATADKAGSFMGSDFSYADMTKPDLSDYDYELAQEGDVRGHKVWIVMATPRTQAVIDEFGYTKSALFVRQDNFVVVRAKRWLAEGGREKYLDVVELEQVDGIWTNLETTMTTKRGKETESKTVLKQSEVSYGNALDADMFTIRRLEKGL